MAGHARRPGAPDAEHVIVVELGEVVFATPQDEQRADDLAARNSVVVISRTINAEPRTVVLAHRMLDGRRRDHSRDIRIVLLSHRAGIESVPSVDASGDQSLGQRRGLTHEEPVPPRGREPGVAAGQGLTDGHVTQDHHAVDAIGMVERQALHDIAAAIVANSVEAMMAERFHERDEIACHRPLTGLRVIGTIRRHSGVPIAAQVRADHAITGVDERRRHCIPRGMGAGMAVHQQYSRTVATISDSQTYVANVDAVEVEALKQCRLPCPS